MEIYLVGGAVRDKLLGLKAREKDWVVLGATPKEMLALGYRQVGKDFPVFLHPETREEYALARTERKTGPGYKGFEFHTSPDVSLEEDLRRRDLTINAMAESSAGELIDPYNGRDDLRDAVLRHVSPAFAEDPVRILRVARFAAQFGKWGFKVAHSTNALMCRMVDEGEVDHLVAERVWAELAKALATDTPEKFFSVLRGCGALGSLFPEIDREYPQPETGHGKNPVIDALQALQQSVSCSDDTRVRFAVLLHALARDAPPAKRLVQAQALCQRLRAPNDYSELSANAIRLEDSITGADPQGLLEGMESAGAFRQADRWQRLLQVYVAAQRIDATRARHLIELGARAAAVNAADLKESDLSGPALGRAIRALRLELIRDGDARPG